MKKLFGRSWRWVHVISPRPSVEDSHVRILQPDEIDEVYIDLSKSEWFVTKGDQPPQAIADLDIKERYLQPSFRIVYRPPSRDECQHLEQAALIWHGHLPSRAFSGRRGLD